MIITIDGPSGTGKSTIAKLLAERLDFTYFDTGALYRSFAVHVKESGKEPLEALADFDLKIENKHYFLFGEDITGKLRTPDVTALSSNVSKFPEVRAELTKIQKDFAEKENVIFEGRDLGTVVFPKAEVKVFLTADAEERAKRRHLELPHVPYDQVLEAIKERDHADRTRDVAPLKQAEDAHLIDTTKLSIEEVIEAIMKFVP